MNKLLLPVFCLLLACNSNEPGTRTTPSGIRYTIHPAATKGRRPVMMATAKVTITHFKKDSAMAGRIPEYKSVLPPAPFTTDPIAEVLITGEVGEGDSVVTLTKDKQRLAFVIQKLYIPGQDGLNIDSLVQIDKNHELHQLIEKESADADRRIDAYLKTKQINAEHTADHLYVQMQQKGAAPYADSGRTAQISFDITELASGKRINSNRDTAFHQPPVMDVPVGRGLLSKGVDRILAQLGKGGRAVIYIPGAMAAGARAADPSTDLSKDIRLDVEVVGVK